MYIIPAASASREEDAGAGDGEDGSAAAEEGSSAGEAD
jgi:hypothetical protein